MNRDKTLTSRWKNFRYARRIFQIISLFLFLFLIFATAALTGAGFDSHNSASLPYQVELFLNMDPLAALTVLLSTFTIPSTMLISLFIIALTIFTGRSFCGWICPLGTLNHGVSEFKPSLSAGKKVKINAPKKSAKIKYLFLITLLITAFFGSAAAGIFDPISIVTRGVALTVLPVINYFGESFTHSAFSSQSLFAKNLADTLYSAGAGVLFHKSGLITASGVLLSIFFASILIANRFVPRMWCRYFCPLGALLGLFSRFSLFELKKDKSKCTDCKKCEQFCSQAASPIPGTKWERAECDLCMNCVSVCDDDALSFGLSGFKETTSKDAPDISRRHVIESAVAGAVIVPVLRTGALNTIKGRPDPACIRPPGAIIEEDFLKRCIRCGQCMKICPNNALHPAFDEAGPEGLFTPVLVPKVGYCEPSCTLCTQVCPTAAIKQVSEDQKTGVNNAKLLKIGTAFIEQGRCLPFSMDTPCTVCEEFCPVSPKAIRLEERSSVFKSGAENKKLLAPFVNPDLCSGCGACENACPVHDQPAIKITSSGESRSPQNKLTLK
ncbi:MAG: 4Fe-4S binding protein [Deltaproteobacteria bacterium]|nr:4Fe-4S binding protein [Deltaproteobacteria bacterium]